MGPIIIIENLKIGHVAVKETAGFAADQNTASATGVMCSER